MRYNMLFLYSKHISCLKYTLSCLDGQMWRMGKKRRVCRNAKSLSLRCVIQNEVMNLETAVNAFQILCDAQDDNMTEQILYDTPSLIQRC